MWTCNKGTLILPKYPVCLLPLIFIVFVSICLTHMNQLIYRAEMTVLSIVRQSGQRLSDYIDLIDQLAILHYD